jgi:hypothetical protein
MRAFKARRKRAPPWQPFALMVVVAAIIVVLA